MWSTGIWRKVEHRCTGASCSGGWVCQQLGEPVLAGQRPTSTCCVASGVCRHDISQQQVFSYPVVGPLKQPAPLTLNHRPWLNRKPNPLQQLNRPASMPATSHPGIIKQPPLSSTGVAPVSYFPSSQPSQQQTSQLQSQAQNAPNQPISMLPGSMAGASIRKFMVHPVSSQPAAFSLAPLSQSAPLPFQWSQVRGGPAICLTRPMTNAIPPTSMEATALIQSMVCALQPSQSERFTEDNLSDNFNHDCAAVPGGGASQETMLPASQVRVISQRSMPARPFPAPNSYVACVCLRTFPLADCRQTAETDQ